MYTHIYIHIRDEYVWIYVYIYMYMYTYIEIYIYVCIYIYIDVCIYTCVCIYIYVYEYTYICMYLSVRVGTYIYIHTSVSLYSHTLPDFTILFNCFFHSIYAFKHAYKFVCICVYVCVCVCVNTYTCIYIHTYMYIYIYIYHVYEYISYRHTCVHIYIITHLAVYNSSWFGARQWQWPSWSQSTRDLSSFSSHLNRCVCFFDCGCMCVCQRPKKKIFWGLRVDSVFLALSVSLAASATHDCFSKVSALLNLLRENHLDLSFEKLHQSRSWHFSTPASY